MTNPPRRARTTAEHLSNAPATRFGRWAMTRALPLLLALFAGCVAGAAEGPSKEAHVVGWPSFGSVDRGGVSLAGHTNTVPDVIGPVDGSAKLTVFTEGNHFPVLLPLLFDAFVPWCAAREGCDVSADQILVVTLPQVMIVRALRERRLRLGNLVLPLAPGGVWPDVVMAGEGPLSRLAERGLVVEHALVLARHRGVGLLMRRGSPGDVTDLPALVDAPARIVVAPEAEAGARRQYQRTLVALIGTRRTEALFGRAIGPFPGRLAIQHRDVPFALLTGQADAGLLFGHLAAFYARAFPDRLVARPIAGAEVFGESVLMARTDEAGAARAPLFTFLLEAAPDAYASGGFCETDEFDFGAEVRLGNGRR